MANRPSTIAPRNLPCEIAVLFRDMETAGGLIDRLKDAADLRANGFSARIGRLGERIVALGIASKKTSLTSMTDAIVYAHKPKLVVIGTLAIGLAEGISANTVILASRLIASSTESLELPPWTNSQHHRGSLWATDQLDSPPTGGLLAAIPADIFAAAKWCRDHDAAIEIVAAVSRNAAQTPPADVRQVLNQPSLAGRMGAFLGAAWRRPGSVPDLWRQKESVWTSREKLGDAIEQIVVPAK